MASGKFVLRLDPQLHQVIKEEAKKTGESLNSFCLKKIVQPQASTYSLLLQKITSSFHPVGIVLFGSVARGEATEKSDIDLLIVLPPSVPITRELYARWEQLKVSDKYAPQFVQLPKEDHSIGSIWLETSLDGEILYDRDQFLKKTLINIRSQIAQGHYLRKISHGHGYWVKRDVDAK
jgi:predicted nucleotidyltransferase